MMRESKDEENKPSLEDLLRFKRSENPSEDFWKRFDRDLEKKIVQSVVHRDSAVQSLLHWVYHHGKVLTAVTCLSIGLYVFATSRAAPKVSESALVLEARPAQAATEALEKVDTWTSRSAPELVASEQNFVIEVLSSGAGPSSGAGRTWLGSSSEEESGAYYVADQLSSSELGWSGERLPF
tara:strand:- start:37823 stop:38365 length:543 start_codon:yes stop_codon:yes gene_type:complete